MEERKTVGLEGYVDLYDTSRKDGGSRVVVNMDNEIFWVLPESSPLLALVAREEVPLRRRPWWRVRLDVLKWRVAAAIRTVRRRIGGCDCDEDEDEF